MPSYLRYPHIQGGVVTFVAEDDVWAAPLTGGRAWRISADHSPATTPRISPDGARVAWTSCRDGAPEVHVASLDGGPARRLTHWGNEGTVVRGWLPAAPGGEPEILVLTPHGHPSARQPWARALPLDGGPGRVLPYGPVGGVASGPGGAVLLLSATMGRGRDAARWKRYRGGTAGKLWIDRAGSGDFQRFHAGLDGNIECPMWVGERVAFLSDHEGVGALYSSLPDGTGLRRHSSVDGGYARQAATDGSRVVYASLGELWCVDSLDGAEPYRLDLPLSGPRTARQPRVVLADEQTITAQPDHTGRGSAVEARGSLHWVTHREGPVRALSAAPGVRARLPRVFRDGDRQRVVWITDADGEDALAVRDAVPTVDGEGQEARILAGGQLGRVLDLQVAPDGRHAAVAAHDGRVLLVTLTDGAVHELDRSEDGDADGLNFSPDSRWLVWSHPGTPPLRQLRIAHVQDRTVSEATPLRFRDTSPAFTRDGKHLAFLSERAFDPLYDAHVFDLSFAAACRPHLLTLAADNPSPFGPQRHGRPVGGATDDGERKDTAKAGSRGASAGAETAGNQAEAAPASRVDLAGLGDRVVPFPVETGRYTSLRSYADGVLWLRHPLTGALGTPVASPGESGHHSALERYDLAKRRGGELSQCVQDFAVTGDGKQVLLSSSGELRLVSASGNGGSGEDDDRGVTLDLARVRIPLDQSAEWRQMYDEAGRLMRDNFWRAE